VVALRVNFKAWVGICLPKCHIPDYIVQFSTVFAARDRYWATFGSYFQFTNLWYCSEHRDVVIKVVSKGHEGLRELKILELLNAEPLKSDPASATVPIVEFLQYDDWHFVVMPFCDGSDEKPFSNAMECLEFAEQVLSVSLSTHLPYIS